jgi:hypothetical protein
MKVFEVVLACCAQNLSFLKKKPTWLVFSLLGAGLLYLLNELIIIFNIEGWPGITYFSVKSFLSSLFNCFLVYLGSFFSSEAAFSAAETDLRSKSAATVYLVGIMWL